MSGWSTADKFMDEDVGDGFPCINNITVGGYLPSDQVPGASKSLHLHANYFSSSISLRR